MLHKKKRNHGSKRKYCSNRLVPKSLSKFERKPISVFDKSDLGFSNELLSSVEDLFYRSTAVQLREMLTLSVLIIWS